MAMAAKHLKLFSILAFVVAISIVGTQAKTCNTNLKDLVNECKQYVMHPDNPKIPPSASCCGEAQKVDIPCMCSKVTKEIEKLVSMEKVNYVLRKCEIPIKSGFQCGSYTVPPNI
ncbi:unnamed protein product [Urochloa decumbens]|uniref:Bifunctional inhibitor/plant lipid transfer protein/seed storage helical domain-containing protein n=1 Tax=Urochloa decumbens TaxID=240449 RepID=A0ABC9AA36_9POAL